MKYVPHPKNHFPEPFMFIVVVEKMVCINPCQALVDLEYTEDVANIAGRVIAGVQVLAGALLGGIHDNLAPVFWNGAARCRAAPLGDVIGRHGEVRGLFGGWRC